MHIVYNIAGFYRPAGMERVLCDKANWLVGHGHKVTIVTTEQKGRPNAFPLDPRVGLHDLAIGYEDNNGGSILDKVVHYPGKQLRHKKALRELLSGLRPDITVSMFCNEVNLVPQIKEGGRKVLEVHFSRFKRTQYGRKGLWALVDRLRSRGDERLVGQYDRFVVLTNDDKANWPDMDSIRVIYNPVHFTPASPAKLDNKTVIAVGRFCHQKAHDRLVSAWGLVQDKEGWTLHLVGDGELRESLEKQVESLGLTGSVVVGHNETDMERIYSEASILALPSRYEGLGMALLECRAFGVPAVSFDCQCGPREIIRDGQTGILVPEGDVQGLADGLQRLISDESLRKRMGLAAFEEGKKTSVDSIMEQWIRLFEEIS